MWEIVKLCVWNIWCKNEREIGGVKKKEWMVVKQDIKMWKRSAYGMKRLSKCWVNGEIIESEIVKISEMTAE